MVLAEWRFSYLTSGRTGPHHAAKEVEGVEQTVQHGPHTIGGRVDSLQAALAQMRSIAVDLIRPGSGRSLDVFGNDIVKC